MMAQASRDSHVGDDVVAVTNPSGDGDFVIVCEHASNYVPSELNNLGLDEALLHSHIAWDPGALGVAHAMAAALDAPLVAQRVSRLVYDCNRDPAAPSAIPATSEYHLIPGNAELDAEQRAARAARYHTPFHDTLAALLDVRIAAGRAPALLTVHSFTPVFQGIGRTLHLGVVHDADARLADEVLAIAGADAGFECRRNDPYGPRDGVTFTLIEHALRRDLPNVMLEIRNDLIRTPADQHKMAERLTGYVRGARANLKASLESGGA